MSPIERLLKEAHARGLWTVLVVFGGGGWGVLEVIDTLIEYGFVPEWVFAGGLTALVLGLPVVMTTAWVQGARRVRPAASAGDPADEAILADVEAGAEVVGSTEDRSSGFDAANLFTWSRAITGGVLAFALLGVLAAGYMAMRATGIGAPGTLMAQGVLDEGATLVLADFESSAGEVASGELITEALRIDIAQSDVLTLMSPADVGATLERMRRAAEEPITEDIALEVAEREGAGGVISGEIGRVGSGFVLNARVLSTDGSRLASFRTSAGSEDDLLEAIDDLARAVRDKVGESLRSIAASPSLGAYSTRSTEALRKLTSATRGLDRGLISPPVAQQLMLEAVTLDSTFATGHVALAIAIANYGGDQDLQARSWEAAFRHRQRLPEAERLTVEAGFYRFSGRLNEAARAYRGMLALDPTLVSAAGNLADILMYRGDYEGAVVTLRSAPAWELPPWWFNLYVSLAGLNDVDGALAVLDTAESQNPGSPFTTYNRSMLLTVFGRLDEAEIVLRQAAANSDPFGFAYEEFARAVHAVVSGRPNQARELIRSYDALFAETGASGIRIAPGTLEAAMSLLVLQDPERALSDLEMLRELVGWEDLGPVSRNYALFALHHALAGDFDTAATMLERFETSGVSVTDPFDALWAESARAFIGVGEGRPGAVDAYELAVPDMICRRCTDLYLGLLYEADGSSADAIEAYERYLASRFYDGDGYWLQALYPVIHERLGALYETEGDAVRAAGHLRTFADLWSGAESSLQPRVSDAVARANALDPSG